MGQANTLYAILGVEPAASDEEVAAAYAQRLNAAQAAGEETALLRAAYDSLRTPELRAAYDRKLARQAAVTSAEETLVIASRSSPLPWLFLLVAVGLAALFWWKKQMVSPRPVVIDQTIVTRPAGGVPSAQVVMPSAAPAAAAEDQLQAAGMTQPDTSGSLQSPVFKESVTLRPPCKAGFDPQCLAWSVFMVRQSNSSGSGVLVGQDRILTNCHVLAGAAINGLVVIHMQTQKIAKVEKYARLADQDVCLLYAPGAGGDVVPWGSSANLKYGDVLYNFGHPGGSANIIWSEAQFLERAEINGEPYLVTSNYCRPGSSGGPLLDDQGRLVGVVTAVQRSQSKNGETVRYGACLSMTEATARQLLSRSLFPIAMAPAQHFKNY